MKCKFCGEELKSNANFCEHCGKEQTETAASKQAEETSAAKMIDAMPELHNELDRIGEMREKSRRRKRRFLLSFVVILACAAAVWFGMYYFKEQNRGTQPVDGDISVPVTSGVPGEVNEMLAGKNFTSVKIFDASTAKDAIDSVKAGLGITDDSTSFVLKNKVAIGNETYYRFGQLYDGIEVYGGEIVLASLQDGTPVAINGRVIETDGLETTPKLDEGGASNAISEYVNKLTEAYHVVEGASVTTAREVVCNFEGITYLAYVSNVSGYNENGEYVAYDAFVDAFAGTGIYVCDTSSYENEAAAELPADADTAQAGETDMTQPAAETPAPDASSAETSAMAMFTVNDKFNWNDQTKTGAIDEIRREDLAAGNASAYVLGTKTAVDKVYAYFKDAFAYEGLDGKNGAFYVYINPNEYLEDKLPPDRALYTGNTLMFIREDLTSGELDINVAAHEYAHGVMYHMARFDGTHSLTENAAVAEGLADVFGELCEAHFNGAADWIHGDRNLAEPGSGYLTALSGNVDIKDSNDCYRHASVISHAMYEMNANGVDCGTLGELTFRSLCLMTKGTDFSQWRSITEFTARNMTDEGKLTEEQFAAVCTALDNTQIKGERLYAWQIDAIGEEAELPAEETTLPEGINEKVIE